MKKTKLKLKKRTYYILLSLVIIVFAIIIGTNVYKDYKYKQTSEYKLLNNGYTNSEIKLLEKNLSTKEIETLSNASKDEFLISILKDEYYIKKNLNRYLNYHKENESFSARKIVAKVNTNTDYNYYTYDLDTNIEDEYLMLVNKYYHLDSSYSPNDLININNKYYYGDNHKIKSQVYDAFIDMWNQAYKENIYLIINSSYRTYSEQQEVYDEYKNSRGTTYADSIAARPGYSEHQTGLALDIFSKDNTTTANFKDSPAHLWLKENAYKYGFIERYTKENEDITGFAEEAWHYRYVGIEVATYIYEHNITFDEYYAYFIDNK